MAGRGKRSTYNKRSDDDKFFNIDWWHGAAARLEAHLPGSVTVTYREVRQHGKPSKMVVDGYTVNLGFANERIADFETYHVMRRTGDKKLCLLYCLFHREMTAEAMEIAESSDEATAFLINAL